MKKYKNTTLNFRGNEIFKGPERVAYFVEGSGIYFYQKACFTITELDQINTHGKSLEALRSEKNLSIAS